MHPRTVGRPPRRTPLSFSSAFHATRPPDRPTSRTRLHSHRAASRHRDHCDFDRPALSRFQSSSKPGQTNAGEKRSHPDRKRGERVLHGVRKVSARYDRRYDFRTRSNRQMNYALFNSSMPRNGHVQMQLPSTHGRSFLFPHPTVQGIASPTIG